MCWRISQTFDHIYTSGCNCKSASLYFTISQTISFAISICSFTPLYSPIIWVFFTTSTIKLGRLHILNECHIYWLNWFDQRRRYGIHFKKEMYLSLVDTALRNIYFGVFRIITCSSSHTQWTSDQIEAIHELCNNLKWYYRSGFIDSLRTYKKKSYVNLYWYLNSR